ncbi:MAG: pectate lyase [Acidobacteriota bacterium]|nr:pectate lyase [Acidobacteriota bacterium]
MTTFRSHVQRYLDPIATCALLLTAIATPPQLSASVIGTNVVAQSLTAERIQKEVPAKDRAAWMAYLKRSEEQRKMDRATLAAELKPGEVAPLQPEEGRGAFGTGMSLNHDAAYFGTPAAKHIADVIVSFQTPAGGWSKNMNFSGSPRLPGQPYAANNLNAFSDPDDFDKPKDPKWNYVGTLDNNSTNTQLHFLAKVQALTPGKDGDAYRACFIKGIRYLLSAQYPNGGFPQVYPLEGGYHDAITFNDNAVSESAETLSDVAESKPGYDFAPADLRRQADDAVGKALKCILASQIVIDGKKTIWAQQEDALTLAPVSARNYEPGALAASESADLLEYMMSVPHPSKDLVASIQAGVAWLKGAAIYGFEYAGGRGVSGGRTLKPKENAGPLWARYYSIPAQKPIFGDRDKTLHDNVNELSLERRNGYAWYSAGEQKTIDDYANWAKANAK